MRMASRVSEFCTSEDRLTSCRLNFEMRAKQAEVQPEHVSSSFDDSDDDEGEVDLSPFQIFWLDLGGTNGSEKIGISGLPGCRFKDTWRNLENDIKCIKSEGIDEVFSLCTKGELNKYRVPWLLSELTGADLNVHHYPFPDGQVPAMGTLLKMVDEIHKAMKNSKTPLVHCYGGLGRSCLVAVCALLVQDETLKAEDVIKQIREIRGPAAIQSVKQYNFVCDFPELYAEYLKENDSEFRSISR